MIQQLRVISLNRVVCRSGTRTLSVFSKDSETNALPTRHEMIKKLQSGDEFDVLIIGGGSVGSGAALDACTRGLRVACVEREDFASGTSSRSTQLLWGGSRYLVEAFVSLLNQDLRLLRKPIETLQRFVADFKMVMQCHQERKFLLKTQPHLTNWIPIAVPITKWLIWPPPFKYPPAALGPLGLFPLFFKFYDALGSFISPPSHIMTVSRTIRKFPQLDINALKYCSVFYEGQHNDARTNLSIAQTAAIHGAAIANYCNVTKLHKSNGIITGAEITDVMTNTSFSVRCKAVLFCGGAFTDELRAMEDPTLQPIVQGASGVHIVLPSYFAPSQFGYVDMNTSDGRFMFFLPWQNSVLVGTTDHTATPTMRPAPDESEIQWLLHEASKYLSHEITLRRSDILSAWCGIRPLVGSTGGDTSKKSRDHTVHYNASSGAVFVTGGKWTTYREMAEDAIDKVVAERKLRGGPCVTLNTHLIGFKGYTNNLPLRLVQRYAIPIDVARHLSKTYGGRAHDICLLSAELLQPTGKRLYSGYPFIEAEVVYAIRHEWAQTADDILSRRCRLVFLNKQAAVSCVPKVVDLMAKELRWNNEQKQAEIVKCLQYFRYFGGVTPNNDVNSLRLSTTADITAAFESISNSGFINYDQIQLVADALQYKLNEKELISCIKYCDTRKENKIPLAALVEWWNSEMENPKLQDFIAKKTASVDSVKGSGHLFG